MNVLIACECSGLIRDAFIAKGHKAMSCDLQETEKPGPHYKGNIIYILDKDWDLLIGHPPCTFIAHSGTQWMSHPDDSNLPFNHRRPHPLYPNRRNDQKAAIEFFKILWDSGIPHICLENPVPMSQLTDDVGMYHQKLQPWEFGDSYEKPTCLWLKNLPLLKNTNEFGDNVTKGNRTVFSSGKSQPDWYNKAKTNNKDNTSRERSRTFPGLAKAMAEQWTEEKVMNYKDDIQLDLFSQL